VRDKERGRTGTPSSCLPGMMKARLSACVRRPAAPKKITTSYFSVDRSSLPVAAIGSHAGNRIGWHGKEADHMQRAIIDMGPYTLDVLIPIGTDLEDAFDAIEADSGESLRINGWLIDNIEFDQAGAVY